MILWTVVPLEAIFAGADTQLPQYEEIEYEGTKLVVEKSVSGQMKVVRVLTTNPADYLRSEFQPGAVLKYEPVVKVLS
ncbi:hypothetical protein SDC9_06165 [bioreactor metagenome]|uniref:YlzJ-like protein n=1 Tax=bioreactor metagenome TaxID=1076179 RepID=A0A644T181_9ZZZZ